jgi:hypothetical protein
MFFSFVPSGYRRWQWPPRQSDINLNAAQMLRRKFSPSDSRFYQPRRESKHELMQQSCKANAKREAKMSTRLALHFLQHMDEWSFTNFCASVPHCLAKPYLNVIRRFRCCDTLSCLRILALHSQDLCHSGTSMLRRGYHTVDEESGNKMDTWNIATVMAPNILRESNDKEMRNVDQGAVKVVFDLIENNDEFSEVRILSLLPCGKC